MTGAPGAGPRLGRLLCFAVLLAATEVGAALLLGRFFDLGRAEPLLFFAYRPWILLAAALIVGARPWRERMLLYAATLLLAFAGESALLLALGGNDPWSGGLRGVLAGSGAALAFDLLVQAGRRFGRSGLLAAAAVGVAVLLIPGGSRPYEAVVLGPAQPLPGGAKPELMLFTALPIIWGEGGAFDPNARPAASYRYLESEFQVRPLDMLEPASLGAGRLLLLAQPRALTPGELVELDLWVRRGGRALILTDPALVWPSKLPLGDIRRPPPVGLLDPLLGHWGLRVEAGRQTGPMREPLYGKQSERRLIVANAGRFRSMDGACQVWLPSTIAHCRIGKGQAWLVADADLLHDALWAAPSGSGLRRRTADNPLLIADWLDELAGLDRTRVADPIQWIAEGASRSKALLIGFAPLLLAGVAGIVLARVGRG